ncbi:STAS domain-containing protein [Limibacillus halophilus]|uniref:Anti-anti-sigma regulatory factor n=1 Tax=Limibacillus halophilus TaxID=1579333 RepID=A0A839STX7_9PROT|nr:STAS domain-containing protein [Limibacillus halophilus]MBB3064856.1 anti-anti-sigma regulatory factor [Limibacillus halophilus]
MTKIIVAIPRRFNLTTVHSFLAKLIGPEEKPKTKNFIFDFQYLEFIDGGGLTALTNIIEWLRLYNASIEFCNFSHSNESVRYLDDCGFFELYLGRPLLGVAKVRKTTLPARQVLHAESFQWLELTFKPWLANLLNMTQASLASINACLKEIFNNIDDHSTKDIGCIHVQHYPNVDRVEVTISDFGVGIPASLSQKYAFHNDGKAILLATQEGITTKSLVNNRGAGLKLLIDYVVSRNNGKVIIYSGHGVAHFYRRPNGIGERSWVKANFYPGTLLNISFRTDTIEQVPDDREDLEW